jgi:HSP20 family protein
MSMVKYNQNLAPLFRDFLSDEFFTPFFEQRAVFGWAPKVDVYEEKEVLHMDFELAGVKKEEVKISLKDGLLTISGERSTETEQQDRTWFYKERTQGCFTRHFKLGDNYDATKIQARYDAGLLHLTVPKKEEVKPVEIKVQ